MAAQELTPAGQGDPGSFARFCFVWLTQSVSIFGTALSSFAATIWLATVEYGGAGDQDRLAAVLAGQMLAFAVPSAVVAPLAGAWADRFDRRRLMMAMDGASAAVSALLGGLALSGALEPCGLFAILAALSALSAVHAAAFDASYVMIVPGRHLVRAHGLVQVTRSLSSVLAPLLGVLLAGLPGAARAGAWPGPIGRFLAACPHGAGLAFALDAVSFAFAAAALCLIRIPPPRRSEIYRTSSLRADIVLGLRFVRAQRPLLWLLGLFTAVNLLTAPESVLVPLLLKVGLAADLGRRGLDFDRGYALLMAAGSAGALAGGVLVSAWGGLRRRPIDGVLATMAALGLCQAIYGTAPTLLVAAAMAFLASALGPALNAQSHAIWQTMTPAEVQGRVFAIRRVVAVCSAPLGMALAGLAGGWMNPGWLLGGAGLALFAVTVAQAGSPHRRALEAARTAAARGA